MNKLLVAGGAALVVFFVAVASCLGSASGGPFRAYGSSAAFTLPRAPMANEGIVEKDLGSGSIWATLVVKLPVGAQVKTIVRDHASSGELQKAVLTKTHMPIWGSRSEWSLRTYPEDVAWDWLFGSPEDTSTISEETSLTGFANRGFVVILESGTSIVFDEANQQLWTTNDGRTVVKIVGIIAATP